MDCPGCGAEIKHVPAGVSKSTGKAYEAFDACSARCGWKPTREVGYKKEIAFSALPSKIPSNGNGDRERAMIMSYAKDIVVAMIARDQIVGDKEVVAVFRTLWSEFSNPLGPIKNND